MKTLPTLTKPAWQQRLQWVLDPIAYLKTCDQQSPGIFNSVVNGGLVVISDPQGMKELWSASRTTVSAPGATNRIVEPLLGPSSIVSTDGDRHRQRRQLLFPPFHGERLQTYGEAVIAICHQLMAPIAVGETFLGRTLTQRISLAVISKTVFGLDDGAKYQELKDLLTTITESFGSPVTASMLFFEALQQDWGAWSPWGKFLRRRSRANELVFAEIEQRRQDPRPRNDILSLLIQAEYDDGSKMSDQELRDELMTLLFAGHETTASAMAWALYWIHRYPEVKAHILDELAALPADAGPMDIARLPYLSAVCNETLRIYPVAIMTFSRQAEVDLTLMDYAIPQGTQLMGCIYLLHQHPDLYPDPETFNPERFLERQFAPHEFMPFGGGERRCVGDALALFELKLALATLLTHYQFALNGDRPETPQRRGITLAPKGNVPLILQGKSVLPAPNICHPLPGTV
ncbi:MAG: cytochrome P450 [Synechocystis sp.]